MARIVIEDVVLYILAVYVISSVIFALAPFSNTYFPGQRYNSTTSSFEAMPENVSYAPSIFGDMTEMNATLAPYQNASELANPGAMLDPVAVVRLVGTYLSFIWALISSTMLYYIMVPFIGASWAHIMTFIFNIMMLLVAIRVITGRIRWD
jgi:hypothetical protein